MVAHSIFHEIVKYCSIAGAVGGAATGILKAIQKILKYLSGLVKPFVVANQTVMSLATNHLPHIQKTLDEHTESMASMRSDIRDIDTKVSGYGQRLDDTKRSVDRLSDAFVNHLEHVAKE